MLTMNDTLLFEGGQGFFSPTPPVKMLYSLQPGRKGFPMHIHGQGNDTCLAPGLWVS